MGAHPEHHRQLRGYAPPCLTADVRQKMKHFAAIALVLVMTGCSEPERVSVAEFKREYEMVGMPQTMKDVEFLGVRDGRAFLKIRSMPLVGSKWKERVTYVELKELDAALRESLEKKPNKAPEPTPPSVTPRADARVAPAGVVAHL